MPEIRLTPRRPTALVVLAILNLLFGGAGLLGAATALAFMYSGLGEFFMKLQQNNPGQIKGLSGPEIQMALAQRVPYYQQVQTAVALTDAAASLVLIATGLGMLKLQRWAWYLAFGYVVVQICLKLLESIYSFVYVTPVMTKLFGEIQGTSPGGFQSQIVEMSLGMGAAGGLAGAILVLIYPLLVLVLLLLCRPSRYRLQRWSEGSGLPGGQSN